MEKTSKTIIYFGNERLATGVTTEAPALQALIEAGYTVAAVVSNYQAARSRSAHELEVQTIATKHGIPVLLPGKPSDIIRELQQYNAEIGVLIAYGKIVPQVVMDIFPKGIINIHPSLLPLHRGPTPVESVILDGSKTTGVSIMQLVKAMDAGPVFAQSAVTLSGQETKQELADMLLEIGTSMLLEVLPGILDGSLAALPQDESKATYDRLITKDDGTIDWHKPAVVIEREIRAYSGWPGSRSTIGGKEVVITKAHVAGDSKHRLGQTDQAGPFRTPDGYIGMPSLASGVLVIERLKPAGKREMSAQEFLAGNKL